MSVLSNWKKRQARNRANVEARKRSRTLLPSAREIFAVSFQTVEARTDKHGRTHTVAVTQPWPDGYSREDLQARVVAAGIR